MLDSIILWSIGLGHELLIQFKCTFIIGFESNLLHLTLHELLMFTFDLYFLLFNLVLQFTWIIHLVYIIIWMQHVIIL